MSIVSIKELTTEAIKNNVSVAQIALDRESEALGVSKESILKEMETRIQVMLK